MKQRVSFFRALFVRFRSWLALLLALVILASFWYGCYWLVCHYAPGQLKYFKVGAWTAGISGLLLLIFNELLVVFSTSAKRIRHRDQCPALWDAVAEAMPPMMIFRPRIYLLPDWGMNAISFGWGLPFLSAVGATDGLVKRLNNEELKAVMAHEIGHIVNKDILVSMVMAVTVMMMAFTGWMCLRLGPYSRSSRSSSDSKGGGALALLVIIIVGFLLYVVGRGLGVILQLFVSRQREYAADAIAARIVHSPRPLISALRRIVDDPGIGSRTANGAFGFLCTADPDPSDLMATHPSIDRRLKALAALEK